MSEAKLTEFDRFTPICTKYGTTPQAARIVICKGRKVGFVLSLGAVSSPACFLNERPTRSTKEAEVTDMTLIPNGWKIALEVKRTIYMGETMIRGGQSPPLYRFSRIVGETGEVVDVSEYKEHPTPAFTEVALRNPVAASLHDAERPNGKLYMGVQYTESQYLLRTRHDLPVAPEAMAKYITWKNLESGAPPPPISLPRASAAAKAPDSPRFAGKRRISDRVPANSLTRIQNIVQSTLERKEDIRSEFDLVSNRPSKLQKEGSLRGAMKLLMESSHEISSPDDLEFDSLNVKDAGKMSAEALFFAFKQPDVNYLNLRQMKRAMETLLQMPVPKRLVEETFAACDTEKTGRVTLQNFVRVIQKRDEELWQQFCRIDYDGDGEITLDELRLAKQNGLFSAQERELNTVLQAMDRVSQREGNHGFVDQKIQWHEFRAMMVLLPPASTIQVIVDVVKSELEERDMINTVLSAPLSGSFRFNTATTSANTSEVFAPLPFDMMPNNSSGQFLLSAVPAAAAPSPPPRPMQSAPSTGEYFFHDLNSDALFVPPQYPFHAPPPMHQQQQQQHSMAFPPVQFQAPLKKPFERSSSFQQYLVRNPSPAPTSSMFVATAAAGGGDVQPPPPPMPPAPMLSSLSGLGLSSSNSLFDSTRDPYREIFGRDEEYESIFESLHDNGGGH